MYLIKRYLIAGLIVWLPLGVTIATLLFLINVFDNSLLLIPAEYRPEVLFGFNIPGLGVVLSLIIILFTGMLAANFLGKRLLQLWDDFLSKIPLVRTIYTAVKQIAEALFGSGSTSFEKVLLIEYPRRGLWTLGFQTSEDQGEAQFKTNMTGVVNVFLPTTPNPTSGFFLMVSKDDVVELDMGADEALKLVISGGVVVPPWNKIAGIAGKKNEDSLSCEQDLLKEKDYISNQTDQKINTETKDI